MLLDISPPNRLIPDYCFATAKWEQSIRAVVASTIGVWGPEVSVRNKGKERLPVLLIYCFQVPISQWLGLRWTVYSRKHRCQQLRAQLQLSSSSISFTSTRRVLKRHNSSLIEVQILASHAHSVFSEGKFGEELNETANFSDLAGL